MEQQLNDMRVGDELDVKLLVMVCQTHPGGIMAARVGGDGPMLVWLKGVGDFLLLGTLVRVDRVAKVDCATVHLVVETGLLIANFEAATAELVRKPRKLDHIRATVADWSFHRVNQIGSVKLETERSGYPRTVKVNRRMLRTEPRARKLEEVGVGDSATILVVELPYEAKSREPQLWVVPVATAERLGLEGRTVRTALAEALLASKAEMREWIADDEAERVVEGARRTGLGFLYRFG